VRVFATVFAVIFVAELPDKTALAALVLATRHKALAVFLGAASALTLQSLVAVAAGGLLSLLPARPVHVGAGVLFVLSAIVMWRRAEPEPEDPQLQREAQQPRFLSSFASTFSVIFIAEWGDLTQLATAALAARYKSPAIVFASATLALWAVAGLAVLIGNRAGRLLSPRLTARVAAFIFLALGIALIAGLL